jgi:menaquinone-9 beta-reductase
LTNIRLVFSATVFWRCAASDETGVAMKIQSELRYDAPIVGGGPAGATAAILLAQAGWTVAVAEKKPFPRRKVCGEFVSATSWPLLRELGVAESLLAQSGPEIRRVDLYVGETILAADMPSPQDKLEGWGRALRREHLDSVLLARSEDAGADVVQPWTLFRVQRITDGHLCSGVLKQGLGNSEGPTATSLRARIVIAVHAHCRIHAGGATARAPGVISGKSPFAPE